MYILPKIWAFKHSFSTKLPPCHPRCEDFHHHVARPSSPSPHHPPRLHVSVSPRGTGVDSARETPWGEASPNKTQFFLSTTHPVNSHIWRFSSGFLIKMYLSWWRLLLSGGGADPKYMWGCLFPPAIPKSIAGIEPLRKWIIFQSYWFSEVIFALSLLEGKIFRVSLQSLTPLKSEHFEPEKGPLEKEKHLQTIHITNSQLPC